MDTSNRFQDGRKIERRTRTFFRPVVISSLRFTRDHDVVIPADADSNSDGFSRIKAIPFCRVSGSPPLSTESPATRSRYFFVPPLPILITYTQKCTKRSVSSWTISTTTLNCKLRRNNTYSSCNPWPRIPLDGTSTNSFGDIRCS